MIKDQFFNWLDLAASLIEKIIFPISKAINALGVGAMVFVMLFTVLDVTLRKAINQPILGTYEIVEFAMVLIVFLGIAYTQKEKGHVSIELLTEKFPQKVQAYLQIIMYLICFCFWLLISIASVIQAKVQWQGGNFSATLFIPTYPFVLAVGIGSFVMALVLLADIIREIQKVTGTNSLDK